MTTGTVTVTLTPVAGHAGYGVPNPLNPQSDWLADGCDTPEQALELARLVIQGIEHGLTFEHAYEIAAQDVAERAEAA